MKAKRRVIFKFKPFSRKQRMVLNWWTENSPVKDYDGIIADRRHPVRQDRLHVIILCVLGNGEL